MFKRIRNFFSSGHDSAPKQSHSGFVDIYGRPIENGVDFFYPKKNVGIPVFSINTIYRHHLKMINDILDKSMIGDHRRTPDGDSVIDELYRKVIKRYISYAHMLPASENHHHSNTGGLIAHSLQAAFFSLQYGRSAKPESTKYQDLDKMVEPIYRYASFVGGLLHDAGKISRDMTVEAVDIVDNKKNRPATKKDGIPIWRPQKESLLGWAKRFGVATYSVKFKPDRLHNSHNIDSAMFLPRVVGTGFAFDYLIENPVNVFKVLSESLSGHETSSDYLSTCIRKADILSVTKDVSMLNDEKLGDRKMSKEALILKSIQAVKPEWTYNVPFGDVWVLGDAVYLRYTKAFDSILKKGQSLQYPLPNDTRIIISIMESSGMLESYDENNKIFNFAPGHFSHEDIEKIFLGEMTPNVEQLLKLKWKGTVFGSDPMPDNGDGILLSHDGKLIEKVSAHGKVTRYEKEKVMSDLPPARRGQGEVQVAYAEQGASQNDQSVNRTHPDSAPPPHEPMPLMDENGNVVSETHNTPNTAPPSFQQNDDSQLNESVSDNQSASMEAEVVPPRSTSTSSKSDSKGIKFKNSPDSKGITFKNIPEKKEQKKTETDHAEELSESNTDNKLDRQPDTTPSDGCDHTAEVPKEVLHPIYEKLNPQYQDRFGERGVAILLDDAKAFYDTTDIQTIRSEMDKAALLVKEEDGRNVMESVKVKGQPMQVYLCLVRPSSIPMLKKNNRRKKKKQNGQTTQEKQTHQQSRKVVESKPTPSANGQQSQQGGKQNQTNNAAKGKSEGRGSSANKKQSQQIPKGQKDNRGVQQKSQKTNSPTAKGNVQSVTQKDIQSENGYQQHLPSIEGVDYGLIAALMSPRKGSLADKIKWLQEQGKTEFYEEKNNGLRLDINEMTRLLSVEKKLYARHMLSALKRQHKIEAKEGVALIPYEKLNVIQHVEDN